MDADQIEEKYGPRDHTPETTKPTNPTNPKDLVGVQKWRQYFCVSPRVMWEVGVGMLEGALKYRRFNYRIAGVRASIYIDAAKGHIDSWVEGEDIDPDSGLSHITKAICSLIVLRDSMLDGNFVDDRPPMHHGFEKQKEELQAIVDVLFEKYPTPPPPCTEEDRGTDPSDKIAHRGQDPHWREKAIEEDRGARFRPEFMEDMTDEQYAAALRRLRSPDGSDPSSQ